MMNLSVRRSSFIFLLYSSFIVHLSACVQNYGMIIVAAFISGVINSIAGGGTLLSFPALVWIGRPAVVANATNTVAIWPGSFAGVIGFRDDIRKLQHWLFWPVIPSLLGGAAGA